MSALTQRTAEWKEAVDAQQQARKRLIPVVRAEHAKGRSMRDIAREMDVALGTVQKLLG